jgi:streptomycin 3"-adenylyltransferase
MAMPADQGDGHALADEVVGILRDVLGASLLGAYLHGSAVLGGLRPTSDLDILAIIDRPTTEDERGTITHRLLEISGRRATRGPARPVELMIVVQSKVRPWPDSPQVEFQYGEWLRDEYEAGRVPAPEDFRDLAVLIDMTLTGNRTLYGPSPETLLDPVPTGDIRRSMVAGVPGLLADLETDTRNVLLTLARILATLSTGEIVPKDAAADLVGHRLPGPARAMLERARLMYLQGLNDDDPGAGWAGMEDDVRAAASAIVSEIVGTELE